MTGTNEGPFGAANSDYWERLRATLVPLLGRLLREINNHAQTSLYAEAVTGRSEFAGFVRKSEAEVEKDLEAMGFERNPLAAWKRLSGTSEFEEASFRRVDASDEFAGLEPPQSALDWAQKKGDPNRADFQLHVILFELDEDQETTAVFAHHEPSWSTHPIDHYKPPYHSGTFGVNMFRVLAKDYYGEDYGTTFVEAGLGKLLGEEVDNPPTPPHKQNKES